ncbi:MAG: thioredoxin TrxC [Steroidobacterales bacterium]
MSDALHLVCPHCDAINRIPVMRLEDRPKCGQCHEPLFAGRPLQLTDANFQKHVQRSDIPLLVDFWAPWCGPCQMMAPYFAEAAAMLEPGARLAKVDTEQQPALASQFLIRSIPTLVLLRGGRELARQTGVMRTADIVRWVRSLS